jgi:hypothetical protein
MERGARLAGVSWAMVLVVVGGAARAEGQSCAGTPVSCGQTVNAQLGSGSCKDSKGGSFDAYTFMGVEGEEVTATISSATPNVDVLAGLVNGPIAGFNDTKEVPVALAATQAGSSQFSVTLNATSADWFFLVTEATPGLKTLGVTAPYTLSVACSGLTGCKADAQTLCMDSGRFEVQATFADSSGQAGQAQAVTLSDDTGYLWFFAPTNVEAVVKVIDGCGLGGHYWVFAGGLTNVRVVLTVTDTKTKTVKKYTNPQNAPFQPIQDTSAFATCP